MSLAATSALAVLTLSLVSKKPSKKRNGAEVELSYIFGRKAEPWERSLNILFTMPVSSSPYTLRKSH